MYSVNLRAAMQAAFGFGGNFKPSLLDEGATVAARELYPDAQVYTIGDYPQSILGTPVLMQVEFGQVNYTRLENGQPKSYSFGGMTMPDVTVCEFDTTKKIIKTDVAGRDGTIKEYVGRGDWNVTMRGMITNTKNMSNDYPEKEVAAMVALNDVPVAVPIFNKLAEVLGISQLVIVSVQFPPLEGFEGVQPFVIQALSDEPFEITIKQGI